jgi:hypothetical protein
MFRVQTTSRPDLFVNGYQLANSGRPRDVGLVKALRALGYFAARAIERLLDEIYDSHRRQVMAVIECSAQMVRLSARGGKQRSSKSRVPLNQEAKGMRIRCSMTGSPCGDRAHLCNERSCAWRAGVSVISHENFS